MNLLVNNLYKFYNKPLSRISKNIIETNMSKLNKINLENIEINNTILELLEFKKSMNKTIFKNNLSILNIVNKIIYLFFFFIRYDR